MPPRICCATCGNPLAHLWTKYWDMLQQEVHPKDAIDSLGIPENLYCCRGTILACPIERNLDIPEETVENETYTFLSKEQPQPIRTLKCV